MFDAAILGAGPAGLGLMSSLYRAGKPLKLCVIDAAHKDQFGNLGHYDIPSDTTADKFLTCLEGLPAHITGHSALQGYITTLRAHGGRAVPLSVAGAYFRALGTLLSNDMAANGALELKAQTKITSGTWTGDHWQLAVQNTRELIKTKQLVLACGASETAYRFDRFLQTYNLDTQHLKAVNLSSDVIAAKYSSTIFQNLRALSAPSVVIIGSSHSAISVAAKLLSMDISFGEAGVTILYRSPMHVTFDSAKDARARGFTDFDDADICSHSNRVFALKGFRLDSAKLLMAIQGYDDGPLETRVRLSLLTDTNDARSILQNADLVISALGYEPNYIPLFNGADRISLNAPNFVNQKSQLLGRDRNIIPSCYALGLASNYNLAGRYGEPSFKGQANGLVLWHKDIGMDIASSLIGE